VPPLAAFAVNAVCILLLMILGCHNVIMYNHSTFVLGYLLLLGYDVTGKECPKYYVDHPDAWEQMKADISAQITIDQGLMGIS